MLEGKELEGNLGDVGKYELDVDDKGNVTFSATVDKDFGYAKVQSTNSVTSNIFHLAEEISKKTKSEWDDKAVAALKKLLGIV